MILFLISFIGGILTVLAPCILPLLPVIVGGSLADGKINTKKSLTVVISLGLSVILFTLLLKVSSLFINIPEYTWKFVSGGIVLFLGLTTLFPRIWETAWMSKMSARSNMLLGKGDQKKSFWGDVIVGAALGPVFSTCSPTYFIVIATVLPVSPVLGMIYLLSYTIGLCLSLLFVTFAGQKIIAKLNIVSDPNSTFKKILGVIFLVVGIAILTGYDKKAETLIINSGFFDVTKIEQQLLQGNSKNNNTPTPEDNAPISESSVNPDANTNTEKELPKYLTLEEKNKKYVKSPELSSIDGYINTDGKPITIASLRGKVVLLDIWTYSCINCQRTIPYINDWYEKYKDQGLEVIGLHTPEFGFEKVQANVEKAVEKFNIKYPVVLDNDYSTWQALGNQFWPRKYLIDMDGYIVYDHAGEGSYDTTEKEIQKALKERADKLNTKIKISSDISKPQNAITLNENKIGSPEIYFGTARNEFLANGTPYRSKEQALILPTDINKNKLYLDGTWNFQYEYAENTTPASVVFKYQAKNVYMVASSKEGIDIEIYKDDIFVKKLNIKDEQLYSIIEGTDYGEHTLKIKVPTSGLNAFTFTFG